jgi:peptidylprolyl isomerase
VVTHQLRGSLLWIVALSLGVAQAADQETQVTATGLKIEELKAGQAGTEPRPGDKVQVHYVGRLLDGKQFDASTDRGVPFEFELGLGQVIAGWDESLPKMQVGGKYRVTIPPAMAYGAEGSPPVIGPNATLTFEIELLKVTKGEPLPTFTPADPARQKTTASGLRYQMLADGQGDVARADQGVVLKWAFWTTEGKLVACSRAAGGPLAGLPGKLSLGRSQLKFLAEAPLLMKPGGCCRLEVPPALAWGDRALGGMLPAGSTTVWQLDLVKINEVPRFVAGDPAKTKTTASGLAYEVVRGGQGRQPKADDVVTVHYTGWLSNGTSFDSSHARGETTSFPLDRVIAGWTEGLQLMAEGAVYRFTIPARLAYGNNAPQGSGIPAGATLVFVVELVRIEP